MTLVCQYVDVSIFIHLAEVLPGGDFDKAVGGAWRLQHVSAERAEILTSYPPEAGFASG